MIRELNHGLDVADDKTAAIKLVNPIKERIKTLKENGVSIEREGPGVGRMYEVNINADPDEFLDWDKTVDQSPKAAEALRAIGVDPGIEGSFNTIGDRLRSAGMAGSEGSRRLSDAGIPGIKYLDQGSRAAGEGSRNYVVFDEDLIEIQRKYAQLGLPVPPIGELREKMQGRPQHGRNPAIAPQLPAPPVPPEFALQYLRGQGT
jgi:hypothetical protein